MQEQNESSWMSSVPPKTLFIGGIVGGVLVLCTIGFFILLGITLKGGSSGSVVYPPTDAPSAGNPSAGQPAPVGKPAAVGSDDHVIGSGKVTVIEYSDFQCPFCQRFHPTIQKLISEYNGKARFVFRSFPLNSIHPHAQKAAEAAECIASLKGNDAFWKYADLLFQNQDALGDALYADLAVKVGVNKSALQGCLSSGKFTAKVKASESEGEQAGVQGTPATFVIAADGSTELIGGALPYEQAKAYIERALQK